MYKKTITYIDAIGNQRTEDFRFHLNKAELAMMNFSEPGGLRAKMERIIQKQDGPAIMAVFRDIILKSYGEPSDDGRRFIKSKELSAEFEQTEAYSQLFLDLCTNPDAANEFLINVIPPDLAEEAKKNMQSIGSGTNPILPV